MLHLKMSKFKVFTQRYFFNFSSTCDITKLCKVDMNSKYAAIFIAQSPADDNFILNLSNFNISYKQKISYFDDTEEKNGTNLFIPQVSD